jgi:hypothetical protein
MVYQRIKSTKTLQITRPLLILSLDTFSSQTKKTFNKRVIFNSIMFSIVIISFFFYVTVLALYDIRTAEVTLHHNPKYLTGYHLHTIGTFPTNSLYDCIYLCQNNDYCRTANYFDLHSGTLCSLFEENSFVGRIISTTSIISFDLCPNGFVEPPYICFGLPTNIQSPVTVQYAMNNLRLVQKWPICIYYPIIFPTLLYVPFFTANTVQIYEWPSLQFISNFTFPIPIYSFDMNLFGSFLLTSSSN